MNRSNVVIHSLLILAISGATNASATWQEPTSPKEKARAITVEGVGIDVPLPIRFGEDQLVSSSRQRPFSELVRLDFDRKRRTGRTLVFLSNGDRLPVVVDKIQNEALFATYNGQTVSIPLEFAAAIAFDLPETNAARRERLRRFSSNREEDTVSLSNGDEVTGEIQSLSAETVRVEAATGLRTIPRKLVTGIQFSKELQSPVPETGQRVIVQAVDGLTVTCSSILSDGTALALTTTCGVTIRIQQNQLASVLFLHSRIDHLSGLKPKSARHTPFLGQPRKWRANRTINNDPLQHAGRTYVRGIGTTSRSEITWTVDRGYESFHTAFGLDDSAPNGAAIFRVLLDDELVFQGKITQAKDGLKRTPSIPVKGGSQLSLIVDFGPRGDIQDYANWIDPIFVRTERPK